MNLLREEFCKETNTPMGLDDVYNYVKWLEDKFQKERSYSEKEVIKTEEDAKIFIETMENIPEPNDKLKKAFRDFNKQETLEEAAENYSGYEEHRMDFIEGATWQQERSYSEQDLEVAFFEGKFGKYSFNDWFEQFKKK